MDKEEIINRILKRGKESGRTDDQDKSIIENRLEVYNKITAPVIDFYALQNKFVPVNGMGSVDEIYYNLCNEIDKTAELIY